MHLAGGGASKRSLPLTVLDPAVRRGVPGKRFVMVIDLAKCDGCGKELNALS